MDSIVQSKLRPFEVNGFVFCVYRILELLFMKNYTRIGYAPTKLVPKQTQKSIISANSPRNFTLRVENRSVLNSFLRSNFHFCHQSPMVVAEITDAKRMPQAANPCGSHPQKVKPLHSGTVGANTMQSRLYWNTLTIFISSANCLPPQPSANRQCQA